MKSRSKAITAQILSILALGLAACGQPVLGTDAGDAMADSVDARRDVTGDAIDDMRADTTDVMDVIGPDAVDVVDASDANDASDAVDAGGDIADAGTDVALDVELDASDVIVTDAEVDAADASDVTVDACALTVCGTACVDTAVDPLHCGSCTNDCTALPGVNGAAVTCATSACVLTNACAPNRADCNNDPADGCEVDLTQAANCGSCGTACAEPSPLCTAGAGTGGGFGCASGCSGSTPTRCSASCVDTTTDPLHCGGCTTACPVRANAAATCASSTCGFTCNANFADCDGDPTNGCERSLLTDPVTCGACGTACSTQNLTPACAAGACSGVCNTGFGNCDNDLRGNGCEHDLRNDVANCGACGNVCPGASNECQTRTCTNGVCGFNFVATGTPVAAQTAGDCQSRVCDGAGGIVSTPNNTDTSSDGNQCTNDTCVAGVPAHPPAATGTTCSQSGGSVCDGAGACVQCVTAATCPGQDTACRVRTCIVGACGFANTAAGTPTGPQTAGDCHTNQCDGAGNQVNAIDNSDTPADDGNQCTSDTCIAGVPSHPPAPATTACNQNGGSRCNGAGSCVSCAAATDCPGSDDECGSRTCVAGVCGRNNAPAGTPTSSQTAGDCRRNQCDGAGNTVAAPDDTDIGSDNNQCTSDLCIAGVPSHPALPAATACNQNGGTFCNGSGSCVQCLTAATCPQATNECSAAACNAGTCGFDFAPSGTPTAAQTPGDCQQNVCNGSGNIVSQSSNTDVPVDGNQCTSDVCTAGVPSNPPAPMGNACSQGGGSVCNGTGTCVQCLGATDCPGQDNDCQTRTCMTGTCGFNFTAAGTPTSTQTTGDCQQNQCNGLGGSVSVASNGDVPVDNNQCTNDVCTVGVPSNPPVAAGTACTQNGGTTCNATGTCVAPFTVTGTNPADAAVGVAATTNISVTFSGAANPATITGQTTAGACTGSIQVSLDDFASCIAFAAASATMSSGNTIATLTPAPGLLANRTYKIRVTNAAQSATGVPATPFTQAVGFTTAMPYTCGAGNALVLSQVYGGGGNSGAPYTNDFVVIHNRSNASVSVAGFSIQYGSSGGTTWSVTPLTGSIAAGGYYLVKLGPNGTVGSPLPTAETTGATTINLSGTAGKVALVNNSTALSGACPVSASIVDFVVYGTGVNCATNAATAPPSNTTSVTRQFGGCANSGANNVDFAVTAPNPQNGATNPFVCSCANNETLLSGEVNYCNVQFPLSLSVQTGTMSPLVYGQVYQLLTTELPGANPLVSAQLGYGPASGNPEYSPAWVWTAASYNQQVGNNDEYQAAFTAPAAGSYRYAYRVSLDNGTSWTYCDLDGAGSNPGLDFSLSQLPVLDVTP